MANDKAVPSASPDSPNSAQNQSTSRGAPPADKTAPPKTLKERLAIPRSATPYFAAAVLAVVAMGWYFFVFVPQKLEYFVGLRFRALAVASGQIKGKSESLGASLSSAPALGTTAVTERENDTAKYLRLLVPDIRLFEEGAPAATGLQLVVNRRNTDPKESKGLRATVPWDRVASQGAAASASEFDDLALADASGKVLWQREKTTPRLGNLTELLYAEDDQGTPMSSSWAIRTVFPAVDPKKGLPKTATLKAVKIGSTSTLMLVQAVHLESPFVTDPHQTTVYVAGFVSRNRLQQQAMRIPLTWLAVVWLPVAVLFLALPFIKLATMQAKERFSIVNLILMAIGTIAAAGLAAVIPVGPRPVSDAGDRVLEEIATLVDTRLGEESDAVLTLAKQVAGLAEDAKGLETCKVPVAPWTASKPCDLWVSLGDVFGKKHVPELDVAIWLDERGQQLRKLTTKAQLTGRAPHHLFQHFQNLASGTLWSRPGTGTVPFTIEPLRAPTTAELAVVFGMPLHQLRGLPAVQRAKAPTKTAPRPEPHFLVLNVRPHAVVDAVMPPGYGFAIVAPDGKVLFHSDDGLSLEENFFEEVSNAQGVRERMQLERAVAWSGDYHGTPHRIHIQPVSTLQGSRWKIITFQDLNPGLAAVVDHQRGTFQLSVLNLVLLLLLTALAVWGYSKLRGRDLRDLITTPPSPDPKRLRGLVVLMLVAAVAIAATGHPLAHQWADILYLVFALLPFVAVGVAVYARSGSPPGDKHSSPLASLELVMLVLLVGAVPTAGFARVVHRVQDVQATERWLEVAHQRTVARDDRVRARATSPAYTAGTSTKLIAHPSFRGGADQEALHFYVPRSPVWPETASSAECMGSPASGQVWVRRMLGWTMFSSDRQGDTRVWACDGSNQLKVTGKGVSLAATIWPASNVESTRDRAETAGSTGSRWLAGFEWERWLLAILILGGTIVAAYWARSRLDTPRAVAAASLENVLKLIGPDGNQGIMLVGPPRMRKDAVVKDAVTAYAFPVPKKKNNGAEPIYRIKLLDATIDKEVLETTLAQVSRHVQQPGVIDTANRLWIHVSNLETQLTTAERRTAVLELLEKLLERRSGETCQRIVVVTTSVDPIAHFHEIFTNEREGIYDDDIPEVELSRSSLLLSRFRRCYLPITASSDEARWRNYEPAEWESTLDWEAAGYPPLIEVADAIKETIKKADEKRLSCGRVSRTELSRAELARTFRSESLASYDLLWESCTRCEKIVLVQLAQEGFVTTQNCEVVWSLTNKGLIVWRPMPRIFNNSFRLFLRHIEHDHVVEQWEREDGNGLWLVAGRLIGSSLIAGGLFYLTTQDFSVDSLLPVVSGTGMFGAPVVRALLARVTMRGAALMS